jgi:spermidine/putrescine transport system permease protein
MSTATEAAPAGTSRSSGARGVSARRRRWSGPRRWDTIRSKLLGLWAGLALIYLFVPIFVVILFSFNDNQGRFNLTWEGFTWSHWAHPFSVEGLGEAMSKSLEIAVISTALAVVLGTFMALSLVRYRFTGRRATDMFVFLPLATPEVVLGAALLGLFLLMNVETGFVTIVVAHTMFNVSYVVVTVKARLEGMDLHIEEAAMDLGANEWTTFRKITLPLIAPGVAAAGLLAFALSIDDFVITNFNAGQTVTFPLFIYGAARQGIPPEVNVLATMLLLAALALMALNLAWQRSKARADSRVPAPPGAPAAG